MRLRIGATGSTGGTSCRAGGKGRLGGDNGKHPVPG